MLFPTGMSMYAVELKFLHASKGVKEFLEEVKPTLSSTSLSVVRCYQSMKRDPILFLEMEDYLENKHGQQTKVRIVFWKETADDEPSVVVLLAEDEKAKKEFYQNLKTFMETSTC